MKIIHYKRATLWMYSLSLTLVKFWVKNPQETPAIASFILEKGIASPRFFSRNVLTEKYSKEIETELSETAKLYVRYGKNFDPKDPKSYRKLEPIISNKSQMLYFLVRKLKPEIFVETGVAAGESTAYILQGLMDNKKGKLYSIDLPFQWYVYGNHKLHLDSLPAGQMPGYLVPNKLKKNWRLILGDTYEKLPEILNKLKEIDIFLHDSEHTLKTMSFEYKQAWPHLKKGGYLMSDDTDFTEAFQKYCQTKKLKAIYFKKIGVTQKTTSDS
jgi:hypothetical protein